MKSKNLILVVLAIAVICAGLWWLMQPSTAMPEKMAEALRPVKVEAAKPVAPPTIIPPVAPPIAPPTPQLDDAPVAATAPSATLSPDPNVVPDPQADLKTAIADIARLIRAGDGVALYQTYTPPDKIDSQGLQGAEAEQVYRASRPISELQQIDEPVAEAFDALEDQTPTFNAAGDEATYVMTWPVEQFSDGHVVLYPATAAPLIMVKINGKWYFEVD